ncbi:MAG: sigma-70 family RNA polymerase sigma factor [Chloroflexi bacterium]|nr:sigma-70 family RNA polymerase sigma factor [Chloroflexota bacterium]
MLQEQLWLSRAQKGDHASFNALVLAYQRQVYNLAFRTLGDADGAADATQDAFLSAYRALRSFRGGSFRAWLLRIAVNACYDRLRRQRRQPADSLERLVESLGDAALAPDPAPGPEPAALGAETAAHLQASILALPEEQRVVVVLSDVQGLSYEEIAAVLGLSLGTVKSRLSRARAKLREYLVARGELPG